PEPEMPASLGGALRKNRKAMANFEALSPSHRREYIQWITEAKTDATRDKRLASAIEWISEGKSRNWKYER
ncbi:MAG TPA: YdeI/OmpD-associated family protein, partial [Gemmatimonadaceae bacterium]|nr:YdeI/OmpD-associated family protein [Gemmatimonadaceae bacterium]